MAEFLLELLSEEIPARMQRQAEKDLERLVGEGLKSHELMRDGVELKAYTTPRRLVLQIKNLPDATEATIEKRKGPRVDAPKEALYSFLRARGKDEEDLKIEEDKKGKFYVEEIPHEGRNTSDILAEILPEIIRKFPWQKSMRWGEGDLRWVRPLHSIMAIFGGKSVVFEIGGIKSGNKTRIHSTDSELVEIKDYEDYRVKLKKAGIILDPEKRFWQILLDAREVCKERNATLVEDKELLHEITGLVESPCCIIGSIDSNFQKLPAEVLQISMKTHQKFLSTIDNLGRTRGFVTVANRHDPSESVKENILNGNQRVLHARLMDAIFFWQRDLSITERGMKPWIAGLEKMTFHNKLGTQADRIARIASFAKTHADLLSVNTKNAETAANLMKRDLCSNMVGEFPELQGIVGGYYIEHARHPDNIVQACKEHYKPLGLKDETPSAPLSVLMALADKLDTLAGFWAVGLTPTSSKDPFALRRAALGVIRLILDNQLRVSLPALIAEASKPFKKPEANAQENLLAFFQDRLKIYLREKESIQPDTIDSCLFGMPPDDMTFLYNRARALQDFRQTPECENLLQGFKRAHNILNAEQKKDGDTISYEFPPNEQCFQDPCEGALFTALEAAEKELPRLLEAEKFPEMLKTLAKLRTPIDTFFEAVQVNSEVEIVRRNRLCLLHKICSTMKTFADFSLLNG